MPTYTATVQFHIDIDSDYDEMINFVESMMPNGSGVHFIQFVNVEQD